MMELPPLDELLVDLEQDSLPPITIGTYRRFMAYGKPGIRALQVYLHLLFTYRLQRTDHVFANTEYLMLGLHMAHGYVKAARSLLVKMGLVEMVLRRGAKGRIGKWYTRLCLLPNPGPTTGTRDVPVESTGGIPAFPGAESPFLLQVQTDHPWSRESKCLKKKEEKLKSPAEAAVAPKGTHASLRDLFCSEYRKKAEAEYTWNYKRDGMNLKRLLTVRGPDGARAVIYAFFHAPAVWTYAVTKGHGWGFGSIPVVLPEIDVYLAAEAKVSRRRTCSECGKAWQISGAECPACGGRLKQEAASA